MLHELKTDKSVFQAVLDNNKTFEVRKNDREFKEGDELWLKETVYTGAEMGRKHNGAFPGKMVDGKPLKYTGRMIAVTVTYILHGPAYGLRDGYCIMATQRA
jgi:hypothetical protein